MDGPSSRYTSPSSDEHHWVDSEYSELEDEEAQGSAAEGYITIDQYLAVLRKKGLLPQAITLHESIEVHVYMMYVCVYVCLYDI